MDPPATSDERSSGAYAARGFYREPGVARAYEERRFQRLFGRIAAALDRRALGRCLAPLPTGSRLLDIACGTAGLSQAVGQRGFEVVGLDISPAMLGIARKRLRRAGLPLPLLVAEAERLPFRDNAFQAAIAIHLLDLLPRDVRIGVLAEARRVAGLVVVDFAFPRLLSTLRQRLYRFSALPRAIALGEAELAAEFEQAGLKERWRVPFLAPFSGEFFFLLEPSEPIGVARSPSPRVGTRTPSVTPSTP
jgi:ubiquinone/menaquinone biosynthesis C-methylase UbiE